MELKETRQYPNSIPRAMTLKIANQERDLTTVDSELGRCLDHLLMSVGRRLNRELLSSIDSELLRLQRQGLANHRFQCTVVPEAVSVRAVSLTQFVWQVWDEDGELIKEFMDQITLPRPSIVEDSCSIVGEDFRWRQLLV